ASDTLTVYSNDGTSYVVTVNITGSNDAAVITGATSGSITEDAVPNTVGGDLNSTDVDGTNDIWNAAAGTSANGYGTFTISASGDWVYTLDNSNPTVNALNTGSPALTDSFTVTTADGTSQVVNITINGHTDATDTQAPTDIKFNLNPASSGLTGNGLSSGDVLGSFSAVDADSATWTFSLSGANAGLFSLSPGGSQSSVNIAAAANIAAGNYTFIVTATDPAGHTFNETYHVGVGTTNTDNAAFFTITTGTDIDFGLNGGDTINGGDGDDALVGGQCTDTINGQLGNDQLIGGAQDDIFVFNTALNGLTNVDKIFDFDASGSGGAGADKVHLDDAIFGGIGSGGTLAATDFAANAGGDATTATQNILYDTTTGNLYYDADGNGVGAKVLVAQIILTGTIDASDFIVI
ncbi:MAG: VCBS domain-containing protein, partial [Sphingomicrobium sp.]